jgi:hypothetical protein
MTTKYFYKGIPLEVLMSDGTSGGNPTTVQNLTNYFLNVPTQTTDVYGTYQIGQVGYNLNQTIVILGSVFNQTTNAFDKSMAYFIDYSTNNTISLQNNPPYKTKYNSVSALLVGGGGGGGGGGGNGYGNPPGDSQQTNVGYSGNGGGGGGFNVLGKTPLANFNSIVFQVGTGGAGGEGGVNQNAQQTAGSNGQNGAAGNSTVIYFYTSPNVSIVSSNANGGGGGGGGYGGSQRNPSQGSVSATIGKGGTGAGGLLSVNGQDGATPSGASAAAGGTNGQSPQHPSFSLKGGNSGVYSNTGGNNITAQKGQAGNDGIIRLYFFNS